MTPMTPDPRQVRRAGAHLVAAVSALQGHRVSWPLEPAFYDLLADPGDSAPILRVPVKTCTSRQGEAWTCWTGRSTYAYEEYRVAGLELRASRAQVGSPAGP
ncbi:MAG: hypothetical protein JWN31_773 [Frankiales bacterium]|nr:hypothetical protein [Frankiales bacterium]